MGCGVHEIDVQGFTVWGFRVSKVVVQRCGSHFHDCKRQKRNLNPEALNPK